MKLGYFALLACFSNAISPDIRINVFGVRIVKTVKFNDPFISEENRNLYEDIPQETENKNSAKQNSSVSTNYSTSQEKKDFKTVAHVTKKQEELREFSAIDKNFGFSLDFEVKHDDYYVGLNIGVLYDSAMPCFKSKIRIPGLSEQIAEINQRKENLEAQKEPLWH